MVDRLRGLKENVIMGRLIPAGTGARQYQHVELNTQMPEPRAEASSVVVEENEVVIPDLPVAEAVNIGSEAEEVGATQDEELSSA